MKRAVSNVFGASVAGLLAGISRLLQNSIPAKAPSMMARPVGRANEAVPDSRTEVAVTPEVSIAAETLKAERHFSIKRTRSEVGYVYWILEGYGKYKCFVLCDSWDEAVAQAKARLAAGGEASEVTTERTNSAVA